MYKTLRLVFLSWRVITLEAIRISQPERASKGESIWTMRKSELQETMRKEMGVEVKDSAQYTVIELREMLKNHRKMQEALDEEPGLPKGLTRLSHDNQQSPCAEPLLRTLSLHQIDYLDT